MIPSLFVQGDEYRDLIAAYLVENYSAQGISVYTEVPFGKTIIGKNRKVDVFLVRESDQSAFAIECKFQRTRGTTDEKIPYALQDLEALWVPGCLAYAGEGWSEGVLHTLRAARSAVYCLPDARTFQPSTDTRELDHVIAAVFGLWTRIIPEARRVPPQFEGQQLTMANLGPRLGPRRASKRRRDRASHEPVAGTPEVGSDAEPGSS